MPTDNEIVGAFVEQIKADFHAMNECFDLQRPYDIFCAGAAMAMQTANGLAEDPDEWPPGVTSASQALQAYTAAASQEISGLVKK